jgi:hypothetical protein
MSFPLEAERRDRPLQTREQIRENIIKQLKELQTSALLLEAVADYTELVGLEKRVLVDYNNTYAKPYQDKNDEIGDKLVHTDGYDLAFFQAGDFALQLEDAIIAEDEWLTGYKKYLVPLSEDLTKISQAIQR